MTTGSRKDSTSVVNHKIVCSCRIRQFLSKVGLPQTKATFFNSNVCGIHWTNTTRKSCLAKFMFLCSSRTQIQRWSDALLKESRTPKLDELVKETSYHFFTYSRALLQIIKSPGSTNAPERRQHKQRQGRTWISNSILCTILPSLEQIVVVGFSDQFQKRCMWHSESLSELHMELGKVQAWAINMQIAPQWLCWEQHSADTIYICVEQSPPLSFPPLSCPRASVTIIISIISIIIIINKKFGLGWWWFCMMQSHEIRLVWQETPVLACV